MTLIACENITYAVQLPGSVVQDNVVGHRQQLMVITPRPFIAGESGGKESGSPGVSTDMGVLSSASLLPSSYTLCIKALC